MAFSKNIASTAVHSLGTGSGQEVSRLVFQLVDGGSMSTSIVVEAKVRGLDAAETVDVPYVNRGTGASVAAGTAITVEGIYEVDATGVEILLNVTHSAGAYTVHVVPVLG